MLISVTVVVTRKSIFSKNTFWYRCVDGLERQSSSRGPGLRVVYDGAPWRSTVAATPDSLVAAGGQGRGQVTRPT